MEHVADHMTRYTRGTGRLCAGMETLAKARVDQGTTLIYPHRSNVQQRFKEHLRRNAQPELILNSQLRFVNILQNLYLSAIYQWFTFFHISRASARLSSKYLARSTALTSQGDFCESPAR